MEYVSVILEVLLNAVRRTHTHAHTKTSLIYYYFLFVHFSLLFSTIRARANARSPPSRRNNEPKWEKKKLRFHFNGLLIETLVQVVRFVSLRPNNLTPASANNITYCVVCEAKRKLSVYKWNYASACSLLCTLQTTAYQRINAGIICHLSIVIMTMHLRHTKLQSACGSDEFNGSICIWILSPRMNYGLNDNDNCGGSMAHCMEILKHNRMCRLSPATIEIHRNCMLWKRCQFVATECRK